MMIELRTEALAEKKRRQNSNPVKGRHKTQIKELEAGILRLGTMNGGNDVGFLTLTTSGKSSWEEEMKKLRSIQRLLKRLFPHGYVRFCQFTRLESMRRIYASLTRAVA